MYLHAFWSCTRRSRRATTETRALVGCQRSGVRSALCCAIDFRVFAKSPLENSCTLQKHAVQPIMPANRRHWGNGQHKQQRAGNTRTDLPVYSACWINNSMSSHLCAPLFLLQESLGLPHQALTHPQLPQFGLANNVFANAIASVECIDMYSIMGCASLFHLLDVTLKCQDKRLNPQLWNATFGGECTKQEGLNNIIRVQETYQTGVLVVLQ